MLSPVLHLSYISPKRSTLWDAAFYIKPATLLFYAVYHAWDAKYGGKRH